MSGALDPVATIARSAAKRLANDWGEGLIVDVETALHSRNGIKSPDRYADPIAIGALVVAIADLAWAIYAELKSRTSKPPAEVVARSVRVRLQISGSVDPALRDGIVEVVVDEAARYDDRDERPSRSIG